jgi:hypothetical protein
MVLCSRDGDEFDYFFYHLICFYPLSLGIVAKQQAVAEHVMSY